MNKKNLANAQLLDDVTEIQTTIEIQQGQGADMPHVPFHATLTPLGVLSTIDNSEIVLVTDVSLSDVLTVERGQRGTTPKFFTKDSVIANGVYAEDLVDTTYQEISESEITDGTASTPRSISGRRAQDIVNKSLTNLSPAIQLNAGKTAVGINKVPENGVLDVDGDIYSNGGKVESEYYKPGDTYSYTDLYMTYSGGITSSGANLFFTVTFPKSVENVNVTLNMISAECRGVDGYLSVGSGYHELVELCASMNFRKTGRLVTFRLIKSDGAWGTNNTLAALSTRHIDVSFT